MGNPKPPDWMVAKRPVCVHCNKVHGLRAVVTTPVIWPGDRPMPPYAGNHVVVRERPDRSLARGFGTIMGEPFKDGDRIAYRDLWDGVTWITPYKPFCTLRCALDYARRAYKREQGL